MFCDTRNGIRRFWSAIVTTDVQTYYRTSGVCQMADVARSAFLRWLGRCVIEDARKPDRRGWRLFIEADVRRITGEASTMNVTNCIRTSTEVLQHRAAKR